MSCPVCNGLPGCPVCSEISTIECQACDGRGYDEDGFECAYCEGSGSVDADDEPDWDNIRDERNENNFTDES